MQLHQIQQECQQATQYNQLLMQYISSADSQLKLRHSQMEQRITMISECQKVRTPMGPHLYIRQSTQQMSRPGPDRKDVCQNSCHWFNQQSLCKKLKQHVECMSQAMEEQKQHHMGMCMHEQR